MKINASNRLQAASPASEKKQAIQNKRHKALYDVGRIESFCKEIRKSLDSDDFDAITTMFHNIMNVSKDAR